MLNNNVPRYEDRGILLKNKQDNYPPYTNPNTDGYAHCKKLAARADQIERGEVVLRPLLTQEQFQAAGKRRRDAIANSEM